MGMSYHQVASYILKLNNQMYEYQFKFDPQIAKILTEGRTKGWTSEDHIKL